MKKFEKRAILEKISKLIALAASPNENEAALALKMADELMKKYHITINEVSMSDSPIFFVSDVEDTLKLRDAHDEQAEKCRYIQHDMLLGMYRILVDATAQKQGPCLAKFLVRKTGIKPREGYDLVDVIAKAFSPRKDRGAEHRLKNAMLELQARDVHPEQVLAHLAQTENGIRGLASVWAKRRRTEKSSATAEQTPDTGADNQPAPQAAKALLADVTLRASQNDAATIDNPSPEQASHMDMEEQTMPTEPSQGQKADAGGWTVRKESNPQPAPTLALMLGTIDPDGGVKISYRVKCPQALYRAGAIGLRECVTYYLKKTEKMSARPTFGTKKR